MELVDQVQEKFSREFLVLIKNIFMEIDSGIVRFPNPVHEFPVE